MSSEAMKVCPECGAACGLRFQQCWMCHAKLPTMSDFVDAEIVGPPPATGTATPVSEWFFGVSTVLVVLVVLLIGFGIHHDDPGLAIAYSIVVAPALLATLVRLHHRKQLKGRLTWADRFTTLIVSSAVTVLVLILIVVAAVAALVAYCFLSGVW